MSVRRKRKQKRLARLKRKSEQGFRGYPLGTVAVYGPTDKFATKLVAGVIVREGSEPLLRKWFSEDADVRTSGIEKEVRDFFREHGVRTVGMSERMMGCSHEEGIDYPTGESCTRCPFWHRRDRFTGELIH